MSTNNSPSDWQESITGCKKASIAYIITELSSIPVTIGHEWHYVYSCLSQLGCYYYYNHFMTLCPGLPWWSGTRRNIHTLKYPDHCPTFISFFHLLWSI